MSQNTPNKVIALVNRKGGVGKTTSAGYIAMCLHEAGHKVTGIDLDPERSWVKWHSVGELPYPVRQGYLSELKQIKETTEGYLVIDSPPNDRDVVQDLPELCDEVIIPLTPTSFDLNRLSTTLKAIAEGEQRIGKALASVLLTRYKSGLNMAKDVKVLLEEKKVPLLDTKIRDLTRYTSFTTPTYLDEYKTVLVELGVLENA